MKELYSSYVGPFKDSVTQYIDHYVFQTHRAHFLYLFLIQILFLCSIDLALVHLRAEGGMSIF